MKKNSKSIWHKLVTILIATVNSLAAIGLVVSAYAGAVNPLYHDLASVVAMTFPFWLIGALLCFAVTVFIRWKAALPSLAGIAVAMPMILDFSPFHLPKSAGDDMTTFTLMSYNVLGFKDQDDNYPGDVNPTISYILSRDADIVCLQEVSSLNPSSAFHITPAQIDSLHKQYPYVFLGSIGEAILSKFPVEPVNLDYKYADTSGAADMAAFRVTVKGRKITIFDIHLQSFSLVYSDREMYMKLTKLEADKQQSKRMLKHLINKIRSVAPQRILDTHQLISYIRKYGGPDVTVCGDFNDIPGCYSLRMLAGEKLKEVYPRVGFGPMITYNSERFYFRIDHILYRGCLEPIDMSRGKIKSSDHYPIVATFAIPDN